MYYLNNLDNTKKKNVEKDHFLAIPCEGWRERTGEGGPQSRECL